MWKWARKHWLLVSVALIAIPVALFCFLICPYHQCDDCARYHPAEHAVAQWLIAVIADPITLFTLALTIATVLMWGVMRDTLKETQKSVVAMEEANRITYEGTRGRFSPHQPPEALSGIANIASSYRNTGKSPANVILHIRGYSITNDSGEPPESHQVSHAQGTLNIPIDVGKVFCVGNGQYGQSASMDMNTTTPDIILHWAALGKPFGMYDYLLYETIGGRRLVRFVWVLHPAGHGATLHESKDEPTTGTGPFVAQS